MGGGVKVLVGSVWVSGWVGGPVGACERLGFASQMLSLLEKVVQPTRRFQISRQVVNLYTGRPGHKQMQRPANVETTGDFGEASS